MPLALLPFGRKGVSGLKCSENTLLKAVVWKKVSTHSFDVRQKREKEEGFLDELFPDILTAFANFWNWCWCQVVVVLVVACQIEFFLCMNFERRSIKYVSGRGGGEPFWVCQLQEHQCLKDLLSKKEKQRVTKPLPCGLGVTPRF